MSDQNQGPPPQQHYPPPYYQDDEITLKELILKIIEFWKEIKKNILWIGLAGMISGGLFYLRASLQETKYTGTLSFMISEEAENKQVALSSDLLGLGTIDYNLDKISALVKSSRIIHQSLLQKVSVDGKVDHLGNHIIDLYEIQEKWNKEPINELNKGVMLLDFRFVEDDENELSKRNLRALTHIQDIVIGNSLKSIKGFLSVSYDQSTEVFLLKTFTHNAELGTAMLSAVYEELVEFYVEKTVGRPQRALEESNLMVDSLGHLLSTAEWALVSAQDRTQGLIGRSAQLNITDLTRRVADVDRRYQSALNTKESLEAIVNRQTPDFLMIDRTYIPLASQSSKIKQLLIGGFLFCFLGVLYVIARKIIRDAMV